MAVPKDVILNWSHKKCRAPLSECRCDPETCRNCDGEIWWVETPRGKSMPADKDGTCHFDSCTGRRSTPAPPAQNAEVKCPHCGQNFEVTL